MVHKVEETPVGFGTRVFEGGPFDGKTRVMSYDTTRIAIPLENDPSRLAVYQLERRRRLSGSRPMVYIGLEENTVVDAR